MYVETMTFEQIRKEICGCEDYLLRKTNNILNDSSYRRVCLNIGPEERRVFKRVDFKYDGFTFHIIPYTEGKRHYKKNGVCGIFFVSFMRGGRLWAASVKGMDYKVYAFYMPHFFDRYSERNGMEYTSTIDIMTLFFKNNHSYVWEDYECNGYDDSVFSTMGDGIGLGNRFGNRSDEYVVFKTYVTEAMLFEDQKGMYEEGYFERVCYMREAALTNTLMY